MEDTDTTIEELTQIFGSAVAGECVLWYEMRNCTISRISGFTRPFTLDKLAMLHFFITILSSIYLWTHLFILFIKRVIFSNCCNRVMTKICKVSRVSGIVSPFTLDPPFEQWYFIIYLVYTTMCKIPIASWFDRI